MAQVPKGNYLALQALRPSEFKVADFIDDKITNYIKEGRAAEAARIKRLQDEGKQLMDINKDIKIDALSTISALQPVVNPLNKEAMDAKAYAGRIANNYNIPYAERAQANRIAQAKADNLVLLGKHLSDPAFIKSYNEKLATDPATVFEGDDTLQFLNSLKNGQIKMKFDENGNPLVAYPNQNQTPDEPVAWRDFSDLAMRLGQGFKKDLSNDIEDLAKQQASNMYAKFEENKTGNVKIGGTKFLRDEANTSFDATFGGYDINNKDPYLEQFSYQVLGKKFIQNEEDYKKVKDAWVNKLESYTPKESTYIVEKSAQELENQRLEGLLKRKSLNAPDSTAATPQSKVSIIAPDISRGLNNEITQIDKNGSGRNVQNATLINLNEKEYVAGYKVKNSNGKGFHTEYAILGRDEQGRFNYNEITKRGDVNIRLAGYGIDPLAVEKIILSGPEAKQGKWGKTSSMNLKSFNQASSKQQSSTSSENPFDTTTKQAVKQVPPSKK